PIGPIGIDAPIPTMNAFMKFSNTTTKIVKIIIFVVCNDISGLFMRQKLLFLSFVVLASIPFLVPHTGWLSLFAFVPLLFYTQDRDDKGVKHTGWMTYLAFVLFNVATTFWIWWISPVGAVAAIALNALQMNFVFWIYRRSRKRFSEALSLILLVSLWIAWEHIYQNIEITWPWLILGNSFATTPYLVQWYEYTGFLGGSLWVLATNIFLFVLIKSIRKEPFVTEKYARRRRVATVVTCALLLTVPPLVSSIIFARFKESSNPREVVAVQPNIDSYTEKHGGLSQKMQDSVMFSLVSEVITTETDYVITPETFTFNLNLDYPEDNITFVGVKDFLKDYPKVNFILGSLTYRYYSSRAQASDAASKLGKGWYDRYNSALLIDSTGRFSYYHKSRLVPGVEIIPYQKYIPFLSSITSAFGGSTGSYARSSDVENLISADGTPVGVMICYESVFGEYYRRTAAKGAGFTAVITNDGWWGDTPGYRQHFRFAKLRAIETRRDV
ncbi:MAG: apolipoprotein N-acyltransferase, partial [Bacteroidales bacterium]|nr:apolipoprotein N-acyltransferase [Bacteroidales bacterium]